LTRTRLEASAKPRATGLHQGDAGIPAIGVHDDSRHGAIPAERQRTGHERRHQQSDDQGPRRGIQQPVALRVLLPHRADQAGKLVPLALGVLSRPVELLHRLAHQHVAGLGNRLLMLLGRQP